MVCLYEEYLGMPKSISIEKCMMIHKMMIEEIGTDECAVELYDEILDKAVEYVSLRAKWTYMDRTWKLEKDLERTRKHDSLIVKFNQLAKYLKMQDKDTKWRDELGYIENDSYNRKVIGDMACFMVYVHACNGR